MANFRGVIKGARGEASRLGHSHLEGRVAGWNIGVGLCAYMVDTGGKIAIAHIGISIDEGNGMNPSRSFSLGTVTESDDGPVWIPSEFAVVQVITDNRAGLLEDLV